MTRGLTIAGYLLVVLAIVGLEIGARRDDGRQAGIGDVFGVLSTRRAGRVAVIIGWWWLGWHFFVR
jgi:hypothetical protein